MSKHLLVNFKNCVSSFFGNDVEHTHVCVLFLTPFHACVYTFKISYACKNVYVCVYMYYSQVLSKQGMLFFMNWQKFGSFFNMIRSFLCLRISDLILFLLQWTPFLFSLCLKKMLAAFIYLFFCIYHDMT